MPNKHTSQPPVELMRARLKVLLENVNFLYSSKDTVVEEDIVTAYHSAMNIFLKSLDGSITGAVSKIIKGSPADPFHYNVFTSSINKDLEALFSEVGALDKLISSSFNSIIAEREQVIQVSRRVSDKLGTYLLYADSTLGGGYFFGDSFNSPENIEVGSSLVDTEECFLGQNEGVILLPLDGEPETPKIKSYIINDPSNGTSGNNHETSVFGKNEIEAIGDNEPNTWYEYERVTSYESNRSLIFDLTITLDDVSVINHININPINFGTPTPVSILKLETSKDGLEYSSIKDEIPLKDFVSEEEDNVFDLSPSTAKFAGQGFYSFLPRKAQFIHIVLEQATPYHIETVNGTRLRYAIGIRDINILGRKFKTEGSIISTQFNTGEEVRKVSLWASENPIEVSALADITHSISENDGATWRAIQPQKRSGFDVPEVIDFNTIADSSIATDIPVEVLRHKISMTRNPDAFSGNVTLKEEKETQIDVLNVPTGGDFSFTTTQQPIKETVRIILPFYGSFSCPTSRYGSSIVGQSTTMDLDFLEFNVDVPPVGSLRYKLPFTGLANLPEHIRVFVNGEQIEYSAKDEDAINNSSTSYGDSVDKDSKIYFLNKGGREIQFGFTDSVGDQRGFLPPTGAKIEICLDGDNPRLELTDVGYAMLLSANSDGFKENTNLIAMNSLSEAEAMDHSIEIPSGRDKVIVTLPLESSLLNQSTGPLPFHTTGKPETIGPIEINNGDGIETQLEVGSNTIVLEAKEGALPPVFLPSSDSWSIVEYDLITGQPLISGIQFTDKVDFIDGRQELMIRPSSEWIQNENAYSFDPYSGTVYTGSLPYSDRKTMFHCKILSVTNIPTDKWEYYKTSIHGRINTQRIIVDPKYVITHKRSLAVDGNITPFSSIDLIGEQAKGHDWFNQRLVKGTVVLDPAIFQTNTKPIEVQFIDGFTELFSITQVLDESIVFIHDSSIPTGDLYRFQLGSINSNNNINGLPGFASVRSENNPVTLDSAFVTYVATTPVLDGEWTYNIDGSGNCTVLVSSSTNLLERPHYVSYKYNTTDPGIDLNGVYSIDYESGAIHFANAIVLSGTIKYETSAYSAFYNIADIVDDGDIKEIDEDEMKITLSTSLGMRFLKLNTAMKARPAFAKIVYDYYKKSTESLADLEPYFSPICKDIAFKAVTISTLEEL